MLSGVGVEKVHFSQNSRNLGDRKCLGKPRKSFVGILTRFYFCEFREKEFFNSHGLVTSIETGITCVESPNWRCEAWQYGVPVLSTPARLELGESVWTLPDSLKLPRLSQPQRASRSTPLPSWTVNKIIRVSGRSFLSSGAASSPVMTGIERSKMITSGLRFSAFSTASRPFSASPEISKSGSNSNR